MINKGSLIPTLGTNWSTFPIYYIGKLDDEKLHPLRKMVDDFKHQIHEYTLTDMREKLAGNIRREYEIDPKEYGYFDELVFPELEKYLKDVPEQKVLSCNRDYIMESVWVNFQQKYEFNPPHDHTGIYSFVIWLDIPYDADVEREFGPGTSSNTNIPGHFTFQYTNALGQVCNDHLKIDKNMNGHIAIFPSQLTHAVHPFYTSDEYRITVAGNIVYDVG
jgi:hypothetical protein